MGSGVGIAGIKPAQYRRFEMLKAVSSTKRLERFYKYHLSAAVRCYAFWALSERDNVDQFELIKSGLSDDRNVSTIFGCLVGKSTVADFIIDNSRGLLSQQDSLTLDSLILFSNKSLEKQKSLLLSIEPNSNYYDRIKELTNNEDVPSAIIGLAKFQKNSDIDLIKQVLSDSLIDPYYPLLAVKSFPDKSFIPDLLSIQNQMIHKTSGLNHIAVRALYKTLVRIDNEEIEEKLNWVVELDNEIRILDSLSDSIKIMSAFEKEFLHIKTDSSYFVHNGGFGKENQYTVHNHLMALRLALFDYPESKYQDLIKNMHFEKLEMDMIKDELKYTDFE
ncbi:MAG TPA: hypothetical protein PKH02_05025 [Bacteroidales bacterium]|nr:hypothetical protein [Bacteroidales bacterium]